MATGTMTPTSMEGEALDLLDQLQVALKPVFKQYRIRTAIVFGSLARGELSRHSDVDLILIQPTGKRFFERYDGLLCDLGWAVPDRDLDVLIYTPEELEYMAHRPFVATALREGKVIYESE